MQNPESSGILRKAAHLPRCSRASGHCSALKAGHSEISKNKEDFFRLMLPPIRSLTYFPPRIADTQES
ncbi:MAG: hypothetical protein EBS01_05535 [Verrucomicrobia bacterium]|nr:hypothetical protein [Verrucomicrobiota bacterium]